MVHAWAIEGDFDFGAFRSNTFTLEWPPRSGEVRQFPEVDRAAWFDLADARSKIHKGQVALLDEMNSKLGGLAVHQNARLSASTTCRAKTEPGCNVIPATVCADS